jgi:hypothetical protein
MGHPQRAVAILLVFASVMATASFVVNPVFSQNYSTATTLHVDSNSTMGVNRTVTIIRIYNTTGFTTSSSFFTQIMVAFVTSTTFVTYVQITFTSSTSTVAYPAPPTHPNPNSVSQFHSEYIGTMLTYASSLTIFMFVVCGLVNDAERGIRKISGTWKSARALWGSHILLVRFDF